MGKKHKFIVKHNGKALFTEPVLHVLDWVMPHLKKPVIIEHEALSETKTIVVTPSNNTPVQIDIPITGRVSAVLDITPENIHIAENSTQFFRHLELEQNVVYTRGFQGTGEYHVENDKGVDYRDFEYEVYLLWDENTIKHCTGQPVPFGLKITPNTKTRGYRFVMRWDSPIHYRTQFENKGIIQDSVTRDYFYRIYNFSETSSVLANINMTAGINVPISVYKGHVQHILDDDVVLWDSGMVEFRSWTGISNNAVCISNFKEGELSEGLHKIKAVLTVTEKPEWIDVIRLWRQVDVHYEDKREINLNEPTVLEEIEFPVYSADRRILTYDVEGMLQGHTINHETREIHCIIYTESYALEELFTTLTAPFGIKIEVKQNKKYVEFTEPTKLFYGNYIDIRLTDRVNRETFYKLYTHRSFAFMYNTPIKSVTKVSNKTHIDMGFVYLQYGDSHGEMIRLRYLANGTPFFDSGAVHLKANNTYVPSPALFDIEELPLGNCNIDVELTVTSDRLNVGKFKVSPVETSNNPNGLGVEYVNFNTHTVIARKVVQGTFVDVRVTSFHTGNQVGGTVIDHENRTITIVASEDNWWSTPVTFTLSENVSYMKHYSGVTMISGNNYEICRGQYTLTLVHSSGIEVGYRLHVSNP